MIGRFDVILWDIDGTLVDFEGSEELCLQKSLARQGAQATPEEIALYKRINRSFWQRYEKGEVTKEALYPGRFSQWFEEIGQPELDPVQMNQDYQVNLGHYPVLYPDAILVLEQLKGRVRQYVVTNGSIVAQKGKMRKSGIEKWMDGVFISEELGVPKPDKRFFDLCAEKIPEYDSQKTVIIGDSLSSDMLGGNNAGIACVWFNPKGDCAPEHIRIDAQIKSLGEIPACLTMLSCGREQG